MQKVIFCKNTVIILGIFCFGVLLGTDVNSQVETIVKVNVTYGNTSSVILQKIPINRTAKIDFKNISSSATFIVTDPGDLPDDSLEDGIFFPQTLRSAIENANLTSGMDMIIIDSTVPEISPLSALPTIDFPVEISDLELNGALITSQIGIGQYGLALTQGASGSTVRNSAISNFPDGGVLIYTNNVTVSGCYIFDNDGPGILGNAARGCNIGNTDLSIPGNFIYDNKSTSGDGIQLFTDIFGNPSDSNVVSANLIGTNGVIPLPNERNGVEIWGSYNWIYNNVVSGNNYDGIRLGEDSDNPSTGNKIEFNIIGLATNLSDTIPNGNGNYGGGIYISYSESDSIFDNTIGGNAGNAIEFAISGNHAHIHHNLIGIDTSRIERRGNKGSGMFLRGKANLIEYNLSGANVNGVQVIGDSNTVRANILGSDFTSLYSNSASGVQISGNYNVIGGDNLSDANICSGNELFGITVAGIGSTGNLVKNNFVGTDSTSGLWIPNGRDGIRIVDSVQSTQIINNVINGNDSSGVYLSSTFGRRPRGTLLEGNKIGIDNPFLKGNRGSGILIDNAVETYIGNPLTGMGNEIAFNDYYGIEIRNGDSTIIYNDFIYYNEASGIYIITGKHNQIINCNINSNDYHGIYIENADSTFITGDSIYYNGGNGISVINGNYNQFLKNYINLNDYLAIDLGNDGFTLNDVNDSDDGPNETQNFPEIFSITNVNDSLIVLGEMDGLPFTTYLIEMYANYYCDASGYGESQEWLDSVSVTSIGDGTAVIDFKSASSYDPSFSNLTFTATDENGNTSEFSDCFELILASADIEVSITADKDSVMIGDSVSYTISITNNGVDNATGTVLVDTIPLSMTYHSDSMSQGSSSLTDRVLSCSIGTIAPGGNADIVLKVIADSIDLVLNNVIATAGEHDPIPQNNSAQTTVEIVDNLTSIISDGEIGLPKEFHLSQNYPNPFNPSTTIEFSLPSKSFVIIDIINVNGQTVNQLVRREVAAGNYQLIWDGLNSSGNQVSSGMYFYRIKTDNHIESKKMLLLK